MNRLGVLAVAVGLWGAGVLSWGAEPSRAGRTMLKDGWALQSSEKVAEPGQVLSTSAYHPQDWYLTSVPTTVVGALVKTGMYGDPFVGMNFRNIPGTTYPIGSNFSKYPMPDGSPFRVSWWFRKEFKVPAEWKGRRLWLHFDGINYRANIWLNGKLIAGSDQVAGAYRTYEFDITDGSRTGTNVVAVEVSPTQVTDLGITWVDWNPAPADKNLGLWREVYLTPSGPVTLRNPQVVTHLNLPKTDHADLTVNVELRNPTDKKVEGTLTGRIEDITFSKPVTLAPSTVQAVAFDAHDFPQLGLNNPRLWWPSQVGPQNLYGLKLTFTDAQGEVSDTLANRFGIREVTSELTDNGSRLFKINGQKILIRGAGWAPDVFLRSDPEREAQEIAYIKQLNLNAIRFEGKMETDSFLRLADENGILVMAGWCCCDHWEHWKDWKPEDKTIAAESLRSQIRRLRQHPSVFTWLNGSDFHPTPEVEQMYIDLLKEAQWPNPYQSSATARVSDVTGKTGFKMNGPYDYVAPNYWEEETGKYGGAWGFSPETGPGAAYGPVESLRAMFPVEHQWPADSSWDFHGGGTSFNASHLFTAAQDQRYGASGSLDEFAVKSQVQAYETHRAMFEAFGRNKYKTATGVVQWMLNNAWPGTIWHLYDYYLRPGGAFFGARKANEPLHIQYSYDDQSVVVVNSFYRPFPGMTVKARVLNLDMTEKFASQVNLDVASDSSTRALVVPPMADLSQVYFVKLELRDREGKLVSDNFYWLPKRLDVLDYDASDWKMTPTKTFANLTPLNQLAPVAVETRGRLEHRGHRERMVVTVKNPSQALAFSVRLKVTRNLGGEEVLPILWEDNYFSLLPGEQREIEVSFDAKDLQGAHPALEVSGWNVTPSRQLLRGLHST